MNAQDNQLGAREAILAKIRRALQIPAPRPSSHNAKIAGHGAVSEGKQPSLNGLPAPIKNGSATHEGEATTNPQGEKRSIELTNETLKQPKVLQSLSVVGQASEWQKWLPPAGEDWESWQKLFAANSKALNTEYFLLDSIEDLPAALGKLARESGWKKVAFHKEETVENAAKSLDLELLETRRGYDADELASCDAGISSCDALIAQTGTVLLGARDAGGRALSVLPPHHIVIARRDQLLPDLPTAFGLLHEKYGENWPSFLTFITGPSRTGDIERILVLGAHGPKRLTIFCF